MARKQKFPHYLVEEPTTGLYAVFETEGARLSYARHATRFDSASDALIAVSAAGLRDQPHELVRIDSV